MGGSNSWIKLHRSLLDSDMWADDNTPFTMREAWIWMLLKATWKDCTRRSGVQAVTMKRGDLIASVRVLASEWHRNKNTVMAYLKRFEEDGMITTVKTPLGTRISIVNYSFYQSDTAPDADSNSDTHSDTHSDTDADSNSDTHSDNIKNNKNIKKEKKVQEGKEDIDSAERETHSTPPVFQIPLNDGSLFPVYQEEIDRFKELYPAVDIQQELRKMCGWCENNPKRRKTKRGVKSFINSWLSRAQDRSGNGYKPDVRRTANPYLDILNESGDAS